MTDFTHEEQAVSFHHTVAQLLFLTTRERRVVGVAMSFLALRVKRPDDDDWGKLKCVLRYLYVTRRLKLTLEVTSLVITKWFVDASHLAHWDCKGHGGAALFLGRGAISSYSNKMKSNQELYRNRAGGSGSLYATDAVVFVLHSGAGVRRGAY